MRYACNTHNTSSFDNRSRQDFRESKDSRLESAGVLNLRRNFGEGVIIGSDASVRVWITDGNAMLGFSSDDKLPIDRCEIWLSKSLAGRRGRITPVIKSVIDDMRRFCPWLLERVDFYSGKVTHVSNSGWSSRERAIELDKRISRLTVCES